MFTPFVCGLDKFDTIRHPQFHTDKIGRELWLSETPYSSANDSQMVYVTAYGKMKIDRGKYEWAIKIKDNSPSSLTLIGIASQSALVTINQTFCNLLGGFGYQTNGLIRCNGKIQKRKQSRNHCSLNKNDILFIRLDLIDKKLSFLKNAIALDIIDLKPHLPLNKKERIFFQLAISMYCDKSKFEIVNPTESIAKYALYQSNISNLPNQDSFEHKGTDGQLMFSIDKKSCIYRSNTAVDTNNNNINMSIKGVDTAYGKLWIPINDKKIKEFEWIIHIQGESPQNIDIGVHGCHWRNIKSFSSEFDKTRYGYALSFNGNKIHYSVKNRDKKYANGGFSCLDFIHVKLNFINKTLKFMRNGHDLGVAWNINNGLHMPNFDESQHKKDDIFGYRLAVKIKKSNCKISIKAAHPYPNINHNISLDSISIINSKTIKKLDYSSNKFDNNNNNSNNMIDDEKETKNIINNYGNNNNWNTNKIFDTLERLNIDLKNGSRKISDMVHVLTMAENDKTSQFKHEIVALKELFRAQQFIPNLVHTNNIFTNNLSLWSSKVTPFIENHFRRWKNWSSDQFTDWIIGFDNGRFNKYNENDKLRNIMKKDDNFETLKEMANNIKMKKLVSVLLRDTFKINDPNDRNVLINALNKLTTGQFVSNNNSNHNNHNIKKDSNKKQNNIKRTFISKTKQTPNQTSTPTYSTTNLKYGNKNNDENNGNQLNYNINNYNVNSDDINNNDNNNGKYAYINKYMKPNVINETGSRPETPRRPSIDESLYN